MVDSNRALQKISDRSWSFSFSTSTPLFVIVYVVYDTGVLSLELLFLPFLRNQMAGSLMPH